MNKIMKEILFFTRYIDEYIVVGAIYWENYDFSTCMFSTNNIQYIEMHDYI
jgi:hypothetical protein